MGIDMCYWSDNNFVFSSLDEIVCQLETVLAKKVA